MSQEHAPNVENMRGTEFPGYCRMHEPTQHHRGISVTTSHVVLIALLTGAESIETNGNFLFLATNGAPREIWSGAEWWRRTMKDESWRITTLGSQHWSRTLKMMKSEGALIPDTRPQEIADAWAATKRQTITLRPDLPATEAEDGLFDLLDAFVEEGNDMILQIAEDVVLGPPLPPELTNLLDALPRRNDDA